MMSENNISQRFFVTYGYYVLDNRHWIYHKYIRFNNSIIYLN